MSVARVVTVLSKVGVALVVIFILVTLVARRSPFALMSEMRARDRCETFVQEDLNRIIPRQRPRVEQCTGPLTEAVCSVATTEGGVRKTAPVRSWDCTKRQFPDGMRDAFYEMAYASTNAEYAAKEEILKERYTGGIQYVLKKLADRRSLLPNPGDPGDSL